MAEASILSYFTQYKAAVLDHTHSMQLKNLINPTWSTCMRPQFNVAFHLCHFETLPEIEDDRTSAFPKFSHENSVFTELLFPPNLLDQCF